MAKELSVGLSFSDGTVQLAILEIQSGTNEIRFIEEYEKKSGSEVWFLEPIIGLKDRGFGKVGSLSLAFDNNVAFLHAFPLDGSFSQSEQNEQVHWELSQLIADFKPNDYITDTHVLRTNAREQVWDVLTVSLRRSLLYGMQEILSEQKLNLHLVDTNHFGAQAVMMMIHPDVKRKTVGLAGITGNRIDVGILTKGRLTDYRYSTSMDVGEITKFLQSIVNEFVATEIMVHGTGATFDMTKALRSTLSVNISMLNPFRKMRVSSSFRGFDKFIGHEHRFAACVGSALRR